MKFISFTFMLVPDIDMISLRITPPLPNIDPTKPSGSPSCIVTIEPSIVYAGGVMSTK